MKKNNLNLNCVNKILFSLFFLTFTTSSFFATETSENLKLFIKGNISDKISALKNASGSETSALSVKTVDFVLENSTIIGNDDRDMNSLAVTGILALPVSASELDPTILTKLYKLFEYSTDSTVKIAILDKIVLFQESKNSDESISVINNFLEKSKNDNTCGDVEKSAVLALGKIGNGKSFTVLYECLNSGAFNSCKTEISDSLGNLADKSLTEIIQLLNSGDIGEKSKLFDLIKKNSKISSSFKAEIAEFLLNEGINISEDKKDSVSQELSFDAFCILVESNWTRASTLVNRYFAKSKDQFISSTMSEEQFAKIIEGVAKLATSDAAKALSEFLAELNSKTEKGEKVSENLVLTLVKNLGNLGNKNAFDQLLLATYLDYPQSVIAEARNALTKLKWEN